MFTNPGCPGVPFYQNLLAMYMSELKLSTILVQPAQTGICRSTSPMPHTPSLGKRKKSLLTCYETGARVMLCTAGYDKLWLPKDSTEA